MHSNRMCIICSSGRLGCVYLGGVGGCFCRGGCRVCLGGVCPGGSAWGGFRQTPPSREQNDRQVWIHYLVATTLRTVIQLWFVFDIDRSTNVALRKPSYQSSQYSTQGASLAVDGNRGAIFKTCAHTQKDRGAWWAVDLQGEYLVSEVYVTACATCCKETVLLTLHS